MHNIVYLDNNATTSPLPSVKDAVHTYLESSFANPSSPYRIGQTAAADMATARSVFAAAINASSRQIVFTSGGTESIHAAIHSALRQQPEKKRIIISAAEHPATQSYTADLAACGYDVISLPLDACGRWCLEDLAASLSEDTAVVSLMKAHNETGLIYELDEAVEMTHQSGALFHTDAVQALGKIPFDATAADVDFASFSAHKIHGLKGTGALYLKDPDTFVSFFHGGGQEKEHRAGTENVPGILALGAASCALPEILGCADRTRHLRDSLETQLSANPGVRIVDPGMERLPNTSLILVEHIRSESLIAALDLKGICVSSGSACSAGSPEPSSTLLAMGLTAKQAASALRFSLSSLNSDNDVNYTATCFNEIVQKIRNNTKIEF